MQFCTRDTSSKAYLKAFASCLFMNSLNCNQTAKMHRLIIGIIVYFLMDVLNYKYICYILICFSYSSCKIFLFMPTTLFFFFSNGILANILVLFTKYAVYLVLSLLYSLWYLYIKKRWSENCYINNDIPFC